MATRTNLRLLSPLLLALAAPLHAQARSREETPPAMGAVEAAPTRMLRLRSGDVLWGSIVEHAPEELRFRRLDTGGTVVLPWSFLDPAEAAELRLGFGYVDSEREELLVDADRLVLTDGTELVGRIVNRTEEHLWVKRARGTVPVPKLNVQSAALVRVPALDVYTREELYQLKASELGALLVLDGLEGARAHDELAQYSERLFDFPHALEHYRYVASLAPEYEPQRVADALARSERKAALAEQVDALAEIDLWRARQRYDRALEGLEVFTRLYPDSPLLEDWNELRQRVERYQERDLREEVVRAVHSRTVKLAREAARRKKTYEEVIAYLDEVMERDLFEAVRADLEQLAPGIEAQAVKLLWSERKGGRYRQASFGLGTWMLGEDRALDTLEEEEEEEAAAPRGSQREARKQLEERIARYLQNQELSRRAQAGAGDEDDPSRFWNEWDHAGRYQWILAHFAEYSGLFHVDRVRFSNCRECGGSGARDVTFTGSAVAGSGALGMLVPCPSCHTIGRVRRIRYR